MLGWKRRIKSLTKNIRVRSNLDGDRKKPLYNEKCDCDHQKPHPYLKKCYLDLLKMPSRPSKSALTKKYNHDLDIKNHLSRKVTKPNFLHHTHLNILMIKILTFPSTYQKPIETLNQYQKPLLSLLRSACTPTKQPLPRTHKLQK